MKKFLVISLVGLFIVALGTAYAQEKAPVLDFKASGFIDAQTEWGTNFTNAQILPSRIDAVTGPYNNPAYNKTSAYLETRARLKFDAKMGKELSGTIYFETDSSRWGETGDGRNKLGVWNGDRNALEIKNVYIDFGVPVIPVPITMRVGLQPLSIRNNLLVYTDGMGITAGIKIDPITIAPLWFKALEGSDYQSDDVDVYGLQIIAKVQTFTAGIYGLYYNMNTAGTNYFVFPATGDVAIPGFSASWASVPMVSLAGYKADPYWVGVFADGKAGPVNLNFDFIYSKMKAEATGLPDIKADGWLARLKVDYPWEKFNFGFVGMYATGDDVGDPDWPLDRKGFFVPPGSETGAIFGESVVFYSSSVNRGVTGISAFIPSVATTTNPGMGGTWLAKVYAAFKVTPEYKATIQAMYIGDTTKDGNTIGTAFGPGGWEDDSSIGIEIDLINEIQIYKNLTYRISGGYLIPGDGLKFFNLVTGELDEKPDAPWLITTNLTYTF